jgi:hypothetical protein
MLACALIACSHPATRIINGCRSLYEGTRGEFVEEVLLERQELGPRAGANGLWLCCVQVHNAARGGITEWQEGAGTWEHMSWHEVTSCAR